MNRGENEKHGSGEQKKVSDPEQIRCMHAE